jgi:hypothetical protein
MEYGNYYAYVSTVFYPYVVGCWGPGNVGKYLAASCTENARVCNDNPTNITSSAYSLSAGLIALLSAFTLLFASLF